MANVADAPVVTCPDWCTSKHVEGDTLHTQEGPSIPTNSGALIDVSVFHDDATHATGVYLGDYELTWEQASTLGKLLTDASYTAALASLSR